jgi:hypothetical protein
VDSWPTYDLPGAASEYCSSHLYFVVVVEVKVGLMFPDSLREVLPGEV